MVEKFRQYILPNIFQFIAIILFIGIIVALGMLSAPKEPNMQPTLGAATGLYKSEQAQNLAKQDPPTPIITTLVPTSTIKKTITPTTKPIQKPPTSTSIPAPTGSVNLAASFHDEPYTTMFRKNWTAISPQYEHEVYLNGVPSTKLVALTFDDGPDKYETNNTGKVLDILKQNGIKATFFLVGWRVHAYPNTVKRISSEGHVIANHSFYHTDLSKITADKVEKELIDTENEIYNLTGKRTAILRAPFGAMSDTLMSSTVNNKYKMVLWTASGGDSAAGKTSMQIAIDSLSNMRPGQIILLHSTEAKAATISALPMIIKTLKDQGYQFVTVDQMLGIPAYK